MAEKDIISKDILKRDEKGLRDYFGMLEILSGNRQLQTLVNEEEEMLSAMKLSDLPSYQKGWQAGQQEGRQEGRQEGKHEGLISVLRWQLQMKFGALSESIEQRLNTASDEQLELWAGQILNAATLMQIFQEERNA